MIVSIHVLPGGGSKAAHRQSEYFLEVPGNRKALF